VEKLRGVAARLTTSMFPIRDDAPRISTPYVTYFLLALNVAIFLFEILLPSDARTGMIYQFGMVPAYITGVVSGAYDGSLQGAFLPLLTSMFLHGSWLHLIANMWALYIFGDNIEDHIGHFGYLGFYLVTGVAASLLHFLFNPTSTVPSVGASGAIAGVMGAYFLLFPAARVLTIVPFFFFFFTWLPAWLVLGWWFVVQFLSGAATSIAPATEPGQGGVAFWAHVGGFVAGAALIKLFPARPPRYRYDRW
jgi:membrane associated rhomboid family serine protease